MYLKVIDYGMGEKVMEAKVDLRVIKTRANIKNTFIDLLFEKEFNEITIQNILDKALINRSTFYKHYSDKYELAEQLTAETLKNAALFINERFSDKKEENIFPTIYKAYAYLYEQRKTILALWKIRTNNINLYEELENLLKKDFLQYLILHNKCKDSSLLDYYSTMYSSLVLTTIKWLLTSGKESDIKKILEQIQSSFDVSVL